jgi:hypothetical protein
MIPGAHPQSPPEGVLGYAVITVPGVRPALFPDPHDAQRYAVRMHGTVWPLHAGKRREERAAAGPEDEGSE